MEGLQNLLRIKLQEAAQCGYEQPTSGVKTQSLCTSPSTDKIKWAFEYIYLLDKIKAAAAEVLYNLLNKLKTIFHESFYIIRSETFKEYNTY